MAIMNPWSSLAPYVPRGVSPAYNPIHSALAGVRDQQRIDEMKRHQRWLEQHGDTSLSESIRSTRAQEERNKKKDEHERRMDAYNRRMSVLGKVVDAYISGEEDLGDLLAGATGLSVSEAEAEPGKGPQPPPSSPSPTPSIAAPAEQQPEPSMQAPPGKQLPEAEQELSPTGPPAQGQVAPMEPVEPERQTGAQAPSPMSLGPMQPPSAEGREQRYIVRDDETGEIIGTFNPSAISKRRGEAQRKKAEAVRRFLTAMRKGDRKEMEEAWRGPEGAAEALIEATGGDVKTARKVLVDLAKAARKDLSAEKRKRMGAQAAMSRSASGDLYKENLRADAIVKEVGIRRGTNTIYDALRETDNVSRLIQSDATMGQRTALAMMLRSLYSARATDQDREQIEKSAGKWEDFNNKLNAWVKGGEITPEFRRQMVETTEVLRGIGQKYLHEAGKTAVRAVMINPFLTRKKQWAEYVYGMVTGGGVPVGEEEDDEEGRGDPKRTQRELGLPNLSPGGSSPRVDEFLELEPD